MAATLRNSMYTISVEDWIKKIQDNPIQRNTVERAKYSNKHHLKQLDPTHANVQCAKLGDTYYKLDGHTRSYLWENSLLEKPSILHATIYDCEHIDDVIQLYERFDSKYAVENSKDKFYGACRFNAFEPKSTLVKNGPFTSALNTIQANTPASALISESKRMTMAERTTEWSETIQLIDSWEFTNSRFKIGTVVALLLTTKIHGDNAYVFWNNYHKKNGTSANGKRDGIQVLMDEMLKHTISSRTGKGSKTSCTVLELAGKALNCYDSYQHGYMYTSGARIKDIYEYIKERNIKVY